MVDLLYREYGLTVLSMQKSSVGAGSDTYFIACADGKYVVKYPAVSDINHPEQEPALCEYLLGKGIPACQFMKNRQGKYLSMDAAGRQFHVQRFLPGRMYGLNEAPGWLLTAQAELLGKIHAALADYPRLPEGIGEGFFRYMTPERARIAYEHSLRLARERGDAQIEEDLRWRLGLMDRFPEMRFDLNRLTRCPTHGDYFISQLLCGEDRIHAVIDWTTACVHPVVWEIFRSYVYAAPECKEGRLDPETFGRYVAAYRRHGRLNDYDLQSMVRLFYYQIAVCDYYGQYYASTADNRDIYLHQAVFSTKLLKWLEKNEQRLTKQLLA